MGDNHIPNFGKFEQSNQNFINNNPMSSNTNARARSQSPNNGAQNAITPQGKQ